MNTIGRKNEVRLLEELYNSGRPEFVCLYGRRRVGKTFIVNNVFRERMTFKFTALSPTGIDDIALNSRQLDRFASTLEEWFGPQDHPKDWFEAFNLLKDCLQKREGRKLVFIDELPWLDTPRSQILSAFENFWNGWGNDRDDLMLVVCGSATSWIVNKLLGNRGGLHNRLTRRIHLKPFTLGECEEYYREAGIKMSRYDQMVCYMIMGGIPYYISLLDKRLSLAQNIDRLFFSPQGDMRKEYDFLFRSLFKRPEPYIKAIDALCAKPHVGIETQALATLIDKKSGGTTSSIISDLENCGFIRCHYPYGHTRRGRYYKVCDAFTLFYNQFIRDTPGRDEHYWTANIGTPTQNSWAGVAFENVCFAHIDKIKTRLGIVGISTDTTSLVCTDEEGRQTSQIDMVLVRADRVVDICEMKFSVEPYRITKDYDLTLRRKIGDARRHFPSRHAIHLVMVTSMGLERGMYSSVAQNEVTGDDLF